MVDLSVLPKNWRGKAEPCPEDAARKYGKWGPGLMVDDDCPMEPSIIIIDEDLKVYRLTDPADTWLILRSLRFSPPIVELYSQTHFPKI